MDKNAIKKFAVWARTELIERVRQRADRYEVTADANSNADSASGKVLTPIEKTQRQAAIARMRDKGYEYVIEEVAYTWFNRFAALRYMELNNYLPSRVRVFTNEKGDFKPQILAEAIYLNLNGLDMEKVYALKESEDNDELYKYLLITQCNALSIVLPQMFKPVDEKCKQEKDDYTILLFPDNLLRDGSVVEQMVTLISEDNWLDEVQIIGWLYQYYNSDPKDKLINAKKQYKKDDIAFVTQLFTSDWIVRYLVENSLGRVWMEGHPNCELANEWKFFLDNGNSKDLENAKKYYQTLTPEKLCCIDPCMGSGHILVYAFDVLMQIYNSYGYSVRESVASIVKNNLYGIDIDERATQLAYFAVMMKACKYDKGFLNRGIQPHIYQIEESSQLDNDCVKYFINGRVDISDNFEPLIDAMKDAKEFGSIITIPDVNFDVLYHRIDEVRNDINILRDVTLNQLIPFINVCATLAKKYELVISNPPYLAAKYMTQNLKDYITAQYSDFKSDLFAAFLVRFSSMCKKTGQIGILTPYVWMFIQSYEKLREYIYANMTLSSLVQLEFNAFEAACVPVVAVTFRNYSVDIPFEGIRLSDFKGIEVQEPKCIEAVKNTNCGYRYTAYQERFKMIPGAPVAYWASNMTFKAFEAEKVGQIGETKQGMTTANNDRFLREWFEVEYDRICFCAKSIDEAIESCKKWFPYNKGGGYRKWYGNAEFVVNYENDGEEIKEYTSHLPQGTWVRIKSRDFYFRESITWTFIAITPGFRYCPSGFIFDVAGSSLFIDENLKKYMLGFLCSSVSTYFLSILNPTMNIQTSDIRSLPIILSDEYKNEVESYVDANIVICKEDWDSYETSWDFHKHPLVQKCGTKLAELYIKWSITCDSRFKKLQENEESLNKIFQQIYSLQELDYKVCEENISISRTNNQKEIRTLISYFVGCAFGRYSLDEDGLVFAGGQWDASKYQTFFADKDGILPICDDEYFDDDITGLFVEFVETVYGKETLEENLKFIADGLGGSGSPREVIRNYFLNDFYTDHCKTYQKRPIYWLFDSGKKNGFKCLIYMHRYQPDTIARIRTDYVHEQQARYRTAIAGLERQIVDASTSERVRLNKQLSKLKDQAEEVRVYEEKIHHLADQMISIDLDDGVKHNYEIFQDVLAKIK